MLRSLLVMLLLALTGCTAGIAEHIRPKQLNAKTALEEPAAECKPSGKAQYAEPLVVDWTSKQRVDLELVMRRGVAVVAYNCERFELLTECHVAGDYAFAGVSRKEDVIQLSNRDELRANLPVQGAKLGGSLERGTSIDLALVRIGKRTTTVRSAAIDELEGECDKATHIVRAAIIGAFAMTRGTVGKVKATADLFGASTSAASGSTKQVANRDGDLAACRQSKSSAPTPPDQCQAALRLELVPLGAKGPLRRKDDKDEGKDEDKAKALVNPCPKGFLYSGSKCARPGAGGSFVCVEDDAEQCTEQCAKGSAESCYNIAVLYQRGIAVKRDRAKAMQLFEKACDGGQAEACLRAANRRWADWALVSTDGWRLVVYCRGAWHAATRRYLPKRAEDDAKCKAAQQKDYPLVVKACDGGSAMGCYWLSIYPNPWLKASGRSRLYWMDRACALGSPWVCSTVGMAYVNGKLWGKPVDKDVPHGIAILGRSCDAGALMFCKFLADIYEDGKAIPRNPRKRAAALNKACNLGHAPSCTQAARLYAAGGIGIKKSLDKALAVWRKGCHGPMLGHEPRAIARSCSALGQRLHSRSKRAPDSTKRRKLLRSALHAYVRACLLDGTDCVSAASLANEHAAHGMLAACEGGNAASCKKLRTHMLKNGCRRNDVGSCYHLGNTDPEAVKAIAEDSCRRRGWNEESKPCKRFIELGGKMPKKKPKPNKRKPKRRR